jgi:hypothetical protein
MALGLYVNSLGQSKARVICKKVCTCFSCSSHLRLFDTLLTNDPSNWPLTAYLSLPLLPLGLISSLFQTSSLILPILLTSHTIKEPVGEQGQRLYEYWSKPENATRLSQMKFTPAHSWPPSPFMWTIIGFPVIRVFYHKFYAHLYLKCMGTPLPPPRRVRGMNFNEGVLAIRIRAVDANIEEQQQVQAPAADDVPDPNAADAEVIETTAASLGRRIGGALILPSISSFMGDLLFRLSTHSGILRSFLGIRQKKTSYTDYTLPPWEIHTRVGVLPMDKELDFNQKAKIFFRVLSNVFNRSGMLVESDPVWCVSSFFFLCLFF